MGPSRYAESQIGIAGQLGRSMAGPLGQVAFALGLEAPGDPPDQVLLVPGTGRLAKSTP